jgi:hypothetical protein
MIDIIDFRTILGIKKKNLTKFLELKMEIEEDSDRNMYLKKLEVKLKLEQCEIGGSENREVSVAVNCESGSGWGLEMGPSDFFDE